MTDETRSEAIRVLKRMRGLAKIRVQRPSLRLMRPADVGLAKWMQTDVARAVADALSGTRYYRETLRTGWLASLDKAIASLGASDA